MSEFDIVRLIKEFDGLPIGTKGTVVLEYNGKCVEVEFVDDTGDTVAVLTTPVEVLEPV